jgi:hypothetical protein
MRGKGRVWQAAGGLIIGLLGGLAGGCGGSGNAFEFFGSPFPYTGQTGQTTSGPGSTGRTTGASMGTTGGGFTDPCTEPQNRKFIRISMRNYSQDYIHYFLVLIAFVNGDEYPTGAVCADDVGLYTSFGYTLVPSGQQVPFGNYCIRGPALYYFHRGGQFRTVSGPSGGNLGSAIAPAQGTTPTYDSFFTSAGAMVPIPDQILFHNPGTTTEGQALKISQSIISPCAALVVTADPNCAQDAFYYVDDTDRLAGSTALGSGSGRRVPSDIQGTACECRGIQEPYQSLAPSGESGLNARCDEFFRGGRIDYAFVRDDTDPPYPQLLWRVTDSQGARAHDYDPRANIR